MPTEIADAYLFIDSPAATAAETWRFWAAVTGSTLAPTRGENDQFTTLLPATGRPWVKLQAIGDANSRTHLDLAVADPAAAAAAAADLGAALVTVVYDDVHVMTTPAGYTFCFTPTDSSSGRSREATTATTATGTRIGQLCLDVPADRFDAEVDFWHRLTGWAVRTSDEFSGLAVPDWFPFWILFQRLGGDDERTATTGHPDVIIEGKRADVVDANVSLGATVVGEADGWTVMNDPSGLAYCLCDPPP